MLLMNAITKMEQKEAKDAEDVLRRYWLKLESHGSLQNAHAKLRR